MLSQNNKERIAYLGALTLLFSYAEMLLPRFVPFFRLGLGNIAILLALELSFPSFLILTVIKAVTSCLMSGTLLSPFFIISLAQSAASGIVMYTLALGNKKCGSKLLSIYGISIAGSAVSAVIQILLSSLYLGSGTSALLGPMLIFSIFSGILTALLSFIMKIPVQTPVLIRNEQQKTKQPVIIIAVLILIAAAAIFMLHNHIILFFALVISLILQKFSGRKILIIPHLSLWLFVIISSLFVPNGKVLFRISSFSITQGALFEGITKSLKLSAVSALSQCAASLRPNGNGIISLVLAYFNGLSNVLRNSEGNIVNKLRNALQSSQLIEQ